jgi:hypothetical protein
MPLVPVYDPDRYQHMPDDDMEYAPLSQGDLRDITPEAEFDEHSPIEFLHPGPLGFVDVTAPRRKTRTGRTSSKAKRGKG